MRYVFFDLGDTLESNDVLLPGAKETLTAIRASRDSQGKSPKLGLISDYYPATTEAEIKAREKEYRGILKKLGIDRFFKPFKKTVTLSTRVGVAKPDARIFRAALDKFNAQAPFHDAIFITENKAHVIAARQLGLRALHFRGPGQSGGDAATLLELVPLVGHFVRP